MTLDKTDMRSLWLNQLPEGRAQQLMSQIALDEGVAEEVQLAGEDLLDDYVANRLNSRDRADFENQLLISDHWRLRVANARALLRAQPSPEPAKLAPPQGRSWQRPVLAAAACAVVAVCGVLLFRAEDAGPTQVLTFLADRQRGAAPPSVMLQSGARSITFQLEVPHTVVGHSYRMRLTTPGQPSSLTLSHLPARQDGPYTFVEATVRASQVGTGDVELRLEAEDSPARDAFVWEIRTARHNP